MSNMQSLYLLVPLAPLLGAIAAGLFGKLLGRAWSHRITIALVAVSFFASLSIFRGLRNITTHVSNLSETLYLVLIRRLHHFPASLGISDSIPSRARRPVFAN